MSDKDHAELAEVIGRGHFGPLRMGRGKEDVRQRPPAVHVNHGHFVNEEYLHCQQSSNLRVPWLRKVQFRLELAVKVQQGMNSGRLDVRAW